MNIKGQCLPNVATRITFLKRNLFSVIAITSVITAIKRYILEQLLPEIYMFYKLLLLK